MKVRIEVETKTFVRFLLVVIAFGLAGWLLYSAATAFIIIFMSFFLAIALSPPVNKLASLFPGNSRLGGTAVAYLAVIAILGGFVFLVVPPIVEQTAKFAQTIPTLANDLTDRFGGVDELIDQYGVRTQYEQALESIEDNATSWASSIGQTLISGAGSLFLFMAALLISLVMTFFMLLEGPVWVKRFWGVYTDKDRMKRHKGLATSMYHVVSSYVNGQLFIALIASICGALVVFGMSFIFDLPANLAIPVAAIVFIGSLVPMFGATVSGALVTVLLAFNDITASIVFLVYFIVYQQIENNLITTFIQAKTLDLSPLVVLISVAIGTYLFGLVGGIISIPIAGCIKVLVEDHFSYARAQRLKKKKPPAKLISKLQRDA